LLRITNGSGELYEKMLRKIEGERRRG